MNKERVIIICLSIAIASLVPTAYFIGRLVQGPEIIVKTITINPSEYSQQNQIQAECFFERAYIHNHLLLFQAVVNNSLVQGCELTKSVVKYGQIMNCDLYQCILFNVTATGCYFVDCHWDNQTVIENWRFNPN